METVITNQELSADQEKDARTFLELYKEIPESHKTDGRALVSAFVSGMEAMKILATVAKE